MPTSPSDNEVIFHAARDVSDPDRRREYVHEACGGDQERISLVEALLAAADSPDSLLDRPAVGPSADVVRTEPSVPAEDVALDFLAPSEKPGSLGRLGHYEVQEVIGRGGMGVVLRAFDEELHRVVAIKVMAQQLASNATARKRFKREAQAVAAVSHDHVVTIHAVEEANGLPYLVMHFVAGLSLQQRLDRDGPLELQEILRIGMQTAQGLAAAHAQGLVHRDVKPANILLENGVERVKITDFGLARAASDANLTQSGVVAGTPSFMSPEQAEGKAVDQRTDLFSLGSVMYATCTGRAPFRASGSMAVLKRVCEETARPIRETNPDVPDWLVEIIDRLHAKDPAGRYQTAAEVAELLSKHLAHLQHPSVAAQPVSRPAKPPASRRRRMVTAVALLALIAGAVVLTAAVSGYLTPQSKPVENGGSGAKGPPAAEPAPHPFVVLGGKGVAERKFETLAEAVRGANDGDTIEIRGNGPFDCGPVRVSHAQTIRAGEGFRPVLQFADNLRTVAPLVLEGLELRRVGQKVPQGHTEALVSACVWPKGAAWGSASLYLVNCRLVEHLNLPCVRCNAADCVLRNCEFLCLAGGAGAALDARRCVFDNCVEVGAGLLSLGFAVRPDQPDHSVQITRSTLRSSWTALAVDLHPVRADEFAETGGGQVRFDVSGTVFDTTSVVAMYENKPFVTRLKPEPEDAKALLLRMLGWRDRGNLYTVGGAGLLIWCNPPEGVAPLIGPRSLADWKKHWSSGEGDAVEGRIKYQGGDLLARLRAAPEKLTPEDFRLRPDSAGYRAGKDKKDLGADVDLVGPGPAYERWKKTPQYQQWLTETGQKQ